MWTPSLSLLAALSRGFTSPRTSEEPPAARRAKEALRTFQDFLADNPDMPSEHRRRFLAEIARCKAEAEWTGA